MDPTSPRTSPDPPRTPGRAPAAAPLFAQVRDALRTEILSGAFGPGDRLPSESELIDRFGVSRITVRQAIAELQSGGLVHTVNGKGSFVTRPGRGQAQGPLVGVLESMRKRGIRARGRLLSHRRVAASRTVARALELPEGSPLGAVTVLRYRDDDPFVVGTTWCDPAIAGRLAAQDLVEQDVASAIEIGLGLRAATTRIRVVARAADRRTAARLAYPPGAPLLRIHTTTVGWDGRPIAYSETDCRADMMDYRVTLRA